LTFGKQVHAAIWRIIHVILDHVVVATRKPAWVVIANGLVWIVLVWGVEDKIIYFAASITPDMSQAKVMSYLMGGGSSSGIGSCPGTRSKKEVIYSNPIAN
jgi:hypothetical protein